MIGTKDRLVHLPAGFGCRASSLLAGYIGGEDGSEATSHAGASIGVSLAQRHARRSSGSPNWAAKLLSQRRAAILSARALLRLRNLAGQEQR
jgi:hypothetical protein